MGGRRRRLRLKYFGVLDRFVIREVFAPTLLGFCTYTFLLLMRPIFSLMEQIFVYGVSFRNAGTLMMLSIPHVVVLTIPMAFLFGVLIALGRMNSDNEIVALQGAGISMRRILMPLLMLSLLITAGNAYLTLKVNPESNRKLRELKVELFASARTMVRVEPRVFNEDFPNILLYVQDVDQETDYWRRMILFDRSSPGEERLTLAQRARLVSRSHRNGDSELGDGVMSDMPNGEPWLLLEDAVTHQFNPAEPETYRVNANQTQLHKLVSFEQGSANVTIRLGARDLSNSELLQMARGEELSSSDPRIITRERHRESQIRSAWLELHKRLAIPAACMVFAIVALPLGVGARSGGRGRGFVISIGVVLVYYVMLNHGELLAFEGRIPIWAGIWAPNIALSVGGLLLMRRMGRWLGERHSGGGVVSTWWKRWQERRTQKRLSTTSGRIRQLTGSIPVHLQRRRYVARFPILLDRYLVRRLLYPFALVLLSIVSLFVVVDLTDHVDEMAKNRAPLDVILGYYWNLVPETVFETAPFCLMIAVLVLFTLLERQNELTAFKAAGLSLYRMIAPVLLIAALCGGGLWLLEESVVPKARRETNRLLDRIKGRETARSYRATDRVWLMSRDGSTLYNFFRYDVAKQEMARFAMFRFDENHDLSYQLFAHRVRYVNGAWVADSGWHRKVGPNYGVSYEEINAPKEIRIEEGPNYFGQEYRKPGELTFGDLKRYIEEIKKSGSPPVKLTVALHQKFTKPLSAFVMVLLALPFALNRGGSRVTTMQGIAMALGLCIAYFLLDTAMGRWGETEILPPVVAAWTPVVLAFLFAINRMTTLRS